MADEIVDGFVSTFRDHAVEGVPASGEWKPVKSEVRALGATIQDEVDDLRAGQASGLITEKLYSALAARDTEAEGFTAGATAVVLPSDTGTHADPVSPATGVTGAIAATVLTVSAGSGLKVGQVLAGTNVTAGTRIASLGSGTGGTGTYNLDRSSTAASTAITVTVPNAGGYRASASPAGWEWVGDSEAVQAATSAAAAAASADDAQDIVDSLDFETPPDDASDYAWAVADEAGKVGIGVKTDGTAAAPALILSDKTMAQVRGVVYRTADPGEALTVRYGLTDINQLAVYGQSLPFGENGLPLANTTQPFDHLMFSGGTRAGSPYEPASPDPYDSFVPLVETKSVSHPTLGETILSTLANTITRLIETHDGVAADEQDLVILGTVSGRGATGLAQLSQGTTPYTEMITGVTEANALAVADDKSHAVQLIPFIQGENDYIAGTSQATYLSLLTDLQADFATDIIAETGQTFEPGLLIAQTASHRKYKGLGDPQIALAQYEAAATLDHVHCALSLYCVPYSSDGGHLSAEGYQIVGAYMARAAKRLLWDARSWTPFMPIAHAWTGDVLEVQFFVPEGALAFDTSWITPIPDGNYGFTAVNSGGALVITSVKRVGRDRLRFTFSGATGTGRKLRYGWGDEIASGNFSGPKIGPRGQLRDSSTDTFTLANGGVFPLHNYCLIFERSV